MSYRPENKRVTSIPTYLNPDLEKGKGKSVSAIWRAKLLIGKHSLFKKCNLYPENLPNLCNIFTMSEADDTGSEM